MEAVPDLPDEVTQLRPTYRARIRFASGREVTADIVLEVYLDTDAWMKIEQFGDDYILIPEFQSNIEFIEVTQEPFEE